ncbi:MAG: M90 family metallopeptidase [Wenzhouxiangella sp.]|jgi:Mlc titration factor MtfA (ptsG expression regulator)|nr:M90 family metallopeptidase [Wenzhouxiangella sp.]
MEPVLIITAAAALAWGTLRFLRARQRRRVARTPLSDSQRRILEQNVPLYRKLPDNLKGRLDRHVQTFLFDKRFHGLHGLAIDEEIRLTVAGTACILLLGRDDLEFAGFTSILVYPSTFVSEQRVQDGLLEQVGRPARLGESWKRGPLILAWDSARHGAGDIKDGHNVILHEFAHKLDEADGVMDGTPLLEQNSQYVTWARAMQPAFDELQRHAAQEIQSVMDHYGATNPAEFFAVLVETFYEKPRQLNKRHPELYAEMRRCFGVDTIDWHDPSRTD